jgi:hypothetical protein
MKGVINDAIVGLVKDKFGEDKLKAILETSERLKKTRGVFLVSSDYDDAITMDLINGAIKVLGVSMDDVLKAFADYWVFTYAQKLYGIYFKMKHNAKEFLKYMDQIHTSVINRMAGAKPPHFEYEEPSSNVLIMHYFTDRKMKSLLKYLIEAVCKYYNEEATVEEIPSDKGAYYAFKITFEK